MPTVVNAAVVDATVNRGGTPLYIYVIYIAVAAAADAEKLDTISSSSAG